ncbi:MAG: hypothetical protein IJX72_00710 [Clostridia bacterium]|nr:hypothetical protein [Clostridia bacterium]
MKKYGKLLALLLALLMVGATAATTLTAILPAAAEGNIQSDSPKKMDAWSSSAEGRGPQQVAEGSVYGIRMSYGAPFDGVEVSMPTWSTKDSAATLSIYKWSEGFETTLKSTPIASQTFDPAKDNAFNKLSFDEQPAGEYLVTISDVRGQVGVWKTNVSVGKGFTYMDGAETQADWEMRVYFTKTPVEPFLPCESANAVSGDHVLPPEAELPADSLIYTHEVMPDTWVFTDGLGRVSVSNAEVGDPKEDKTLAMFYWTWHTKAMAAAGYTDTTKLLEKYPEAKNDYNHAAWTGTGHYCFWNEPIYGFYRTDDAWVLRRQAELLANAGVDVIFADNTNGNMTWRTSYLALYETWDDAQKNGAVDVPTVSYLLPFGPNDGSKDQIESLYMDIYRPGKYQNLWFYWEDKPMLMAHNSNITKANNLGKEILNFFTFRAGQPEYRVSSTGAKQWGWLSVYPQALYSTRGQSGVKHGQIEQMTVGVAVNHNYVTKEITAMNGVNVMGRSYTSTYENRYEVEGAEASKWGYQFSEQFDYALEVSPPVLFVTGWNEWHAWRQPSPWGGANSQVSNALVDQFDDEHSRDLEPTKGELQDHYYYLFVNYARQYKGAEPIPTPSLSATIDLTAGYDQWKTVEPYYAAYIGNTFDRDAKGYGSLTYTETSGRNDIIGAQVARDDSYVYFLVECAENITPYTDSLWMNLYIDSDQSNQGWNTFEYVVNKSAAGEKTLVLEKFTAENDYSKTEKVADVEYVVDGRYMTVKIAKSDLGLSGNDYTVNFSWPDNVHDEGDYNKFSGDIMDFYISGDVAPGGRFKYSYISTNANTTGEEETTAAVTDTPTEPVTDPVTEPATETPTEAESQSATEQTTEPAEGGCGAAIVSLAASVMTLAATVVLKKRKEDR